jgi:hypothetical protein
VGRRVELAEAQGGTRDLEALAHRQVAVAQQLHRAGADRGDPAALVDHGHVEREPLEARRLAEILDEAEVGGAAAQRDVLAVVRRRRRVALALRQRLDGAAERRAGLQHHHLVALGAQVERSCCARDAAADDDGPHSGTSPRPTMASLRAVGTLGRRVKTS